MTRKAIILFWTTVYFFLTMPFKTKIRSNCLF